MPPQPLESVQNAAANDVGFPNEAARGGTISLAMLIDFIIQRTYHELTVLAELYAFSMTFSKHNRDFWLILKCSSC